MGHQIAQFFLVAGVLLVKIKQVPRSLPVLSLLLFFRFIFLKGVSTCGVGSDLIPLLERSLGSVARLDAVDRPQSATYSGSAGQRGFVLFVGFRTGERQAGLPALQNLLGQFRRHLNDSTGSRTLGAGLPQRLLRGGYEFGFDFGSGLRDQLVDRLAGQLVDPQRAAKQEDGRRGIQGSLGHRSGCCSRLVQRSVRILLILTCQIRSEQRRQVGTDCTGCTAEKRAPRDRRHGADHRTCFCPQRGLRHVGQGTGQRVPCEGADSG